jgi:K+-transporting ATPase c subunit
MSVTGTTNETALATVSIPAGAMGLNGAIHVVTSWTMTNSANAKTVRARLGGVGGTAFMGVGFTATATFSDIRRIRNQNSASAQVGSAPASSTNAYGSSTSALPTGAIDTGSAQDLVLTGTLANTGETITLTSYEV